MMSVLSHFRRKSLRHREIAGPGVSVLVNYTAQSLGALTLTLREALRQAPQLLSELPVPICTKFVIFQNTNCARHTPGNAKHQTNT